MKRRTMRLLCILAISSCLTAHKHDEHSAAQSAISFAQMAFIAHNVALAYPLLAEETRQNLSRQEYEAAITRMHPHGFPATVTATGFEPIPRQRAMNIVLVGQNGHEKFFYRLVLLGAVETGYRVGGFFRGSGPYPGSDAVQGQRLLQPLNPPYKADVHRWSRGLEP